MVFSWSITFCIMSSLDLNLVPFSRCIFSLSKSHKSHGAMSGVQGAWGSTWVLQENSISNVKNERVCYRDGAANYLLPLDPFASQSHEDDAEHVTCTPWWPFDDCASLGSSLGQLRPHFWMLTAYQNAIDSPLMCSHLWSGLTHPLSVPWTEHRIK